MEKRSTEGQMDYEWQDRRGPVDASSPFMLHAANHQKQQTDSIAKKRPPSALNSPTKGATFPSLRDPSSTPATFLFSPTASSKPLPPAPTTKDPQFMTPRSRADFNYDSSEVENNSSPEYNADSDATPEKMGVRSGAAKVNNTFSQIFSSKSPKKNSTSGAVTLSGKGELARGRYTSAAERRIQKNRRRKVFTHISQNGNSETDNEMPDKKPTKSQNSSATGLLTSVFGFIEMHPNMPHILSYYAQLLLNVFLVAFFIYLIYCFWATIRSDVDKKTQEVVAGILAEMDICKVRFVENNCGTERTAPALGKLCEEWGLCMKQNPHAVGRARVSAHTFAEIFNSFIEPISYKAMIFVLILTFGCVGISNFAFGFFRNKAQPPPPALTTGYGPSPYMQTPQRQPSGSQPWSAYQSPVQGYSQGMESLNMQSPEVRRLQY